MEISEFLNTEMCDYACYDNIRKIASVVDGFKNSSRKVIYTMIDKNMKGEVKVDALANTTAGHTEYLHGASNLNNVIVNLAQNYVGTNNLPLLTAEGNFGTRFIKEASAPRYIYTAKQDYLKNILKNEDEDILVEQIFEGTKIEPRYYLPILPMIVINGSEGVSTGFAQKILPRKVDDVKKYVKNYLEKGTTINLKPCYEGFEGKITNEDTNKWRIEGNFYRDKYGKVVVTEIPPHYELKSYLNELDKLEDNKSIKSYRDYCSENICFEVTFEMKKLQNMSDEDVLKTLKLIKYETENFTCVNENNKIIQFQNIHELMKYYIDFRLNQYNVRKENQIKNMNKELDYMNSKYHFIQDIINDKINVKDTKQNIISQIEKNDKILKWDNSYDYLLRMQIFSLTKERCDQLIKDINAVQNNIKELSLKTEKSIWSEELNFKEFKK